MGAEFETLRTFGLRRTGIAGGRASMGRAGKVRNEANFREKGISTLRR
jgi:hypothetical protein